MMIDAIIPNGPDGKNVNKGGGMDCMKNGEKSVLSAEFNLPGKDQSITDFSILYKAIAKCNEAASVETEQNVNTESISELQEEDIDNIPGFDIAGDYQLIADLYDNSQKDNTGLSSVNNGVASELVRDALSQISEILNLPSCNPEHLNLEKVTESTIEQFAEIIHVLKQIISALDSSLSSGESIDFGNGEIGSECATELSSKLRIEQFKIEMGTQLLGVAADIQNAVAQKSEQLFTSGINQAINPLTVTMPVEQIKKLFVDIIGSSEKKELKGVSNAVIDQAESEMIDGQAEVEMIDNGKKQISSLPKFDTSTYRKLLNVDKSDNMKEQGLSEVTDSGANLSVDNLNGLTTQTKGDVNIAQESELFAIPQSMKTQTGNMREVAGIQITDIPSKTIDESKIIEQITRKMQSVNRSGISEVRIQLRPESLGEVKLSIRIEGDIVFARIQVESQQIRQIVESNLQTLKDALAHQNLFAASIDVNIGRENMDGEATDWQNQQFKNGNRDTEKQFDERGTEDGLINQAKYSIGNETGKRYGNNSIEYFA